MEVDSKEEEEEEEEYKRKRKGNIDAACLSQTSFEGGLKIDLFCTHKYLLWERTLDVCIKIEERREDRLAFKDPFSMSSPTAKSSIREGEGKEAQKVYIDRS